MSSILRIRNHLVAATILSLLAGCASTPENELSTLVSEAVESEDFRPDSTRDLASVEYLIRNAKNVDGEERLTYLRLAARLIYYNEDIIPEGDHPKTDVSPEALAYHRARIEILAAEIAMQSHLYTDALIITEDLDDLRYDLLFEVMDIRAKAYADTGNEIEAIRTLIIKERLAVTDDDKEEINDAIWGLISSLPTVELETIETTKPTLSGWISLSRIMRNSQSDISGLQTAILDWGTEYPYHPVSNLFIDRLITDYQNSYKEFGTIALLLPTSGDLKVVGDVIIDGFLSAYYQSNSGSKPAIRFYDTGAEGASAISLYDRAISEGAEFVIGPMEKEAIDELVATDDHEIPTLTLNYAEDLERYSDNLFQFGLLPEDEARQVARRAFEDGRRSVVILTPESEWGGRIARSFSDEFASLGGEVLSEQTYPSDADDFSKPIKTMLNLHQSEARYSQLKRILGENLQFTPYRRQDVDMIFVAATSRAARGILPALKFHHAADIATYSTSHAYTGNVDRKADRDLDGLMFCDIPWTLVTRNPLKTSFDQNWQDVTRFTRLFAMGVDAYALMHNLNYLKTNQNAYFVGETGNLVIDERNRLHRNLIWARFTNGRPRHVSNLNGS